MDVTPEALERLGDIPRRKLLVGGAALPFYGVNRGTLDIDLEIQADSQEEFDRIREAIEASGLVADVTANFEGWGMIPLPEGFRERVIPTPIRNLFVLDPVDYVFSKLRRGTEQDIEDCLAVVRARAIRPRDIRERKRLLRLPLDPVSHVFNRIFDRFMEAIESEGSPEGA